MCRQRLFTRGIEQTFLVKLRLELFVTAHQFADAGVFQVIDDQLVLAARLVQRHLGAQQYLLPVYRLKSDAAVTPAKHRRAALCPVILQGKIPVTGGGACKVRNLALDPQRTEPTTEQGFDFEVKCGDGPDGRVARLSCCH